MFAKELLNLKPGTFIKGIRFLDMSVLDGRSATLNIEGWCCDVAVPIYNVQYTLRTPWYTNPTFDLIDGNQAIEDLISCRVAKFEDPIEESFTGMSWSHFDYDNPIGVHLGAFAIYGGNDTGQITICTKILRCDGEVGCIALVAKSSHDIYNEHLELL